MKNLIKAIRESRLNQIRIMSVILALLIGAVVLMARQESAKQVEILVQNEYLFQKIGEVVMRQPGLAAAWWEQGCESTVDDLVSKMEEGSVTDVRKNIEPFKTRCKYGSREIEASLTEELLRQLRGEVPENESLPQEPTNE